MAGFFITISMEIQQLIWAKLEQREKAEFNRDEYFMQQFKQLIDEIRADKRETESNILQITKQYRDDVIKGTQVQEKLINIIDERISKK
jgi:DnaJ-domain-containing protein 1